MWTPIPRTKKTIPWGYELDPDNPKVLLPIYEQLELLEEAKIILQRHSLREVAKWLTAKSGRYITYEGLRTRILAEKENSKKLDEAKAEYELAKQLNNAWKKLKKERAKLGNNKISSESEAC